MTRCFKTTLIEPLHNLTRVPPIQYILDKLIDSYLHRLQGLPLNAKTQTILSDDQCQYWPDYIIPSTNLHCAFHHPTLLSHWVEGQDLHEAWNTPHFYYDTPTPIHKTEFRTLNPAHAHIVISAHADAHSPYAIYQTPHIKGTI
jgi:hypothetical protein